LGRWIKEDALRFPARGLLAAGLSLSFLLATASSGRAASPTATTTVAAVPCGDVNGDGIVDVGDALVVAQFDVGLRQCSQLTHPEACDVNGDGSCNIGDALHLDHHRRHHHLLSGARHDYDDAPGLSERCVPGSSRGVVVAARVLPPLLARDDEHGGTPRRGAGRRRQQPNARWAGPTRPREVSD
jgi:hypothetical protein